MKLQRHSQNTMRNYIRMIPGYTDTREMETHLKKLKLRVSLSQNTNLIKIVTHGEILLQIKKLKKGGSRR